MKTENKLSRKTLLIQCLIMLALFLIMVFFVEIARAESLKITRACELCQPGDIIRQYDASKDQIWRQRRATARDCLTPDDIYVRINRIWVNLAYMVDLKTWNPPTLPDRVRTY